MALLQDRILTRIFPAQLPVTVPDLYLFLCCHSCLLAAISLVATMVLHVLV